MDISTKGTQVLLKALTKCVGITDTGKCVQGTVKRVQECALASCFSYDKLNKSDIKQSKDYLVKVLLGGQDLYENPELNYYASIQIEPTKRIRGAGLMIKIQLERP